jgi:hypothetical protein
MLERVQRRELRGEESRLLSQDRQGRAGQCRAQTDSLWPRDAHRLKLMSASLSRASTAGCAMTAWMGSNVCALTFGATTATTTPSLAALLLYSTLLYSALLYSTLLTLLFCPRPAGDDSSPASSVLLSSGFAASPI